MAVALGSGGARGYAHIGALEVLHERGCEVVSIAGSSMGALVGGLHAAGALPDYTEWARGLTQRDVLRLLDPSFSSPGAFRAEKIFARMRELLGEVRIEDLPVPYTAVATDLLARREVWFQHGPLATAVRASVSIPGLFPPVMLNGRLLADGGLMDPVPLAPTAAVGADLTIAVSLIGERRGRRDAVPVRESAEPRPAEEWMDRLRRGTATLLDRDFVRALTARFGGTVAETGVHDQDPVPEAEWVSPFGPLPPGLSKLDVMNQSLDAMQAMVMRYRLAGYAPDVLVEVPKDACRSLDFHRADELIALGRELTAAALDAAGLPLVG